MCCTGIFMHFIRNNPIYTNRYYYSFIEIIGTEKYLRAAYIRNEWDSARYSFDKMYGLISAWCKRFDMLDEEIDVFDDIKKSFSNFVFKEVDLLKSCFSVTENEVFNVLRFYKEDDAKNIFDAYLKIKDDMAVINNKRDKNKSDYKQLTDDIEKIEKITDIYRQILELSNSVKN